MLLQQGQAVGMVLQVVLTAGTAGAGSRLLSPGVFSYLSVEGHVRFQAEDVQQHKALIWLLSDCEVAHSVQAEPKG